MHKRIVRKDGLVVLLVPRAESNSVTWEVMFKVGSRQERKSINGASHFIEHLFFKGTKKRPTTKILSRELDAVGAHFNAFTGKDHTGYYIQTSALHMPLGIDMLSDMLLHSKFESKDIDRERTVIMEEMNMYRDNPLLRIDELFDEIMLKDSSLGWGIGGPNTVLERISRKELIDYRTSHYYAGNMVVGVAGNFNEAEVLKLINKKFPIQKKRQRKIVKRHVFSSSGPRIALENRETSQVQLMLGFPSAGRNSKDRNALMLLSTILGGTMSSRLFITIREQKGLCYDIRSSHTAFEDVGYFSIHAGLDTSRIYQAVKAIKSVLDGVARNGVSRSEFAEAKENIRGRLALRFEDASTYLTYLIGQELLGKKIQSFDQKVAAIEKVTREDVNAVANKLINWNKSCLALIGPFSDETRFKEILLR